MFIMVNNVTNNVIINNITGYPMCICIISYMYIG